MANDMSRQSPQGATQAHGHSMDRELVSSEPHELRYLAETHGTSVAEIEAVIEELGTRSRKRIEEELDKRYPHRRRGAQPSSSNAGGDASSGMTGKPSAG